MPAGFLFIASSTGTFRPCWPANTRFWDRSMTPLATVNPAARRQACSQRSVVCKIKSMATGMTKADEEVAIRRRPPLGVDKQPCGPVDFKVPLDASNEPRNILEEIVWWKAKEIEEMRQKQPLSVLSGRLKFAERPQNFRGCLMEQFEKTGRPALIAEVKKASPSRGVIQPNFNPVDIAKGYEKGGATCLSILTDSKYFQGSFDNLNLIRAAGVQCPLLCKEFIVEAYQLSLARVSNADAVLLIAAVLPNKDLTYLMKSAKALGLQCLVEVHSEAELQRVLRVDGIEKQMIGINNRDLTTFKVDLNTTKRILESEAGQQAKERGLLIVGESGIFSPEDVEFLLQAGCQAILVGESIVKQDDQKAAVSALLGLPS